MEIRYDQRQLRLRVRDDSKGIDPTVLNGGGRPGHYGLPGMHERAKLVGGSSQSGVNSTPVPRPSLTIPASVAYAKSSGTAPLDVLGKKRLKPRVGAPIQFRILCSDDHPLFRSGIAALPATSAGHDLVAGSLNGREAIERFRAHRPDITLMDLQMPEMNGLDAIAIRDEFPEAQLSVLTTLYTGDVQVLRAMKTGARAYLLKNLLDKELLQTIRAVHAGKKTLAAEASYELAEHATDDALTPGEVEVLRLIAAGNANKQIAAELSITEETVKGRVKNILSKLGANDRTHAAMIGIKRGIIQS